MTIKDQIQADCLSKLLPVKRGTGAVTMGGGKTLIGLKHMHENYTEYCKFLVAAPKVSIHKEWLKEAKQYNMEYLIPHITFTTYLSLDKADLDYDVIYLDECHSLKYTHESWLDRYTGKIIGLTGTPPKFKTSEKGYMVNKFCPIVFTYITKKAVDDKMLNDYRVIVHLLPLDFAKTMKVEKGEKVWYTSEGASYNYWTQRIQDASSPKEIAIMRVMRMKALQEFPSKDRLARKLLNQTTDKTILFANTQIQADSFGIPSYHSSNPDSDDNLEKFRSGQIMKLACVHQLSEGINVPNLKAGIIMHAYGNERKFSQRFGRLLRLLPKERAIVHVLCYSGTVDVEWVKTALSDLDQTKISYISAT